MAVIVRLLPLWAQFQQRCAALPASLEALPKQAQLLILVGGVYLFFGIHNFLQEALMNQPGFSRLGVMLGYFEVLGVTLCCFVERQLYLQADPKSEYGQRKAPLSAYPMLTLCLLSSSALSNLSLNYINFPTKVVFRSCKLIPTMVIASFLHKKVFSGTEYVCATMACVGLICFAAADFQTRPSFHPVGLVLVSASVCADAVLPNVQESLFRNYQASRLEVTLYTNAFTLILMTLSTLASGDLWKCIQLMLVQQRLSLYIFIYTFIAYIAIGCHMMVVQRYGGVAAVLIATGRKAMTLMVSFLLFPKAFTWFYPLGTFLVLTGLTWASLSKVYATTTTTTNKSVPSSETRPFKAHMSDVDDLLRPEHAAAASPA
jgi:solute carrier family 35 (adenosine 3'-phospho 5'-phosphosulfate transporter), member B3